MIISYVKNNNTITGLDLMTHKLQSVQADTIPLGQGIRAH
jgi:hypothetical protein